MSAIVAFLAKPAVKYGAIALAALGIYLAWTYHQREIGRQEIIAKDAKAVAEQAVKDRTLSALLVQDLRQALDARAATAGTVRERIVRIATDCSRASGPDVDAAVGWVRDSLSQTGRPPARP